MNSTLNIAPDNLTLAFQPIVRIVNEDTSYLYVKSIIDIYIPINLKNNMV